MNVEIKIDSSYIQPKIIIYTCEMNEKLNEIVKKLSESSPQILAGFKGDMVEILDQKSILRFYSEKGKVYASTEKGLFLVKLRLYEVEERLENNRFVRISNSEIINLRKVKSFDLSFSGTICVILQDNSTAYVSRRYVTKIKNAIGI